MPLSAAPTFRLPFACAPECPVFAKDLVSELGRCGRSFPHSSLERKSDKCMIPCISSITPTLRLHNALDLISGALDLILHDVCLLALSAEF
ncbi:hypothetical protein PoB_006695900 [Plakobranchus ocellatus]|uniref:Uncharacterized protein n=1 Tax=Plakobranchus ocellatus TaxID=259542 RepID=A0AAV4D8G9_9GAST|nr:hypothetical protein PoB_006695900 [Plakobranchus ocellatus]